MGLSRLLVQDLRKPHLSLPPRSTFGYQFSLSLLGSLSLRSNTGDCLVPGQTFVRQFGPKVTDRGLRLCEGSLC